LTVETQVQIVSAGPTGLTRAVDLRRRGIDCLGSSAKGTEYFLRHLLGTDAALRAGEAPPEHRPRDDVWRDEARERKPDLLGSLDFSDDRRPA
jgi:nitrate reductase alpha subunit